MNLTDNEILKFLKGGPVFIDDICAVYSLTLGEIIDVGYDKFLSYLSILTATKPPKINGDNELNEMLKNVTDFQYILLVSSLDLLANLLFKEAFLFFTKSSVVLVLDPPSIIIEPIEELRIIDELHFYDILRVLRRMYFLELEGEEIIINADDDPITRSLKLQMRANQEKVRRAKAAKAALDKSNLKMSDLIGSMAINDCGLNMINIYNITYYAFHDLLKRMGWRDLFNINLKAALAGAKINKSLLKHWMRSIADDK